MRVKCKVFLREASSVLKMTKPLISDFGAKIIGHQAREVDRRLRLSVLSKFIVQCITRGTKDPLVLPYCATLETSHVLLSGYTIRMRVG